MDVRIWRLFLDAADLGSLSKVATAHGTNQPQVSRQIRELENETGGRLFQRTGRGVALTEFGKRVAPRVRAWLASTEQLANDIRVAAGTPIGTVRLGILPSTAHPLVSRLYQRLRTDFPLVRLAVREGQGAQLETWLESGNVDLAILFRHPSTPKGGDVYLVETETYLIGPIDSPVTAHPTVEFAALHDLPLVHFCRPNSWRDRLERLAEEHGIRLNVVLEADSLSLQTHVVEEAGGFALFGPYAVNAAAKECQIKASRLINPGIKRHIALAMSPHGELTLACRTAMKIIKELVRADSGMLATEPVEFEKRSRITD